MLTRVGLDQMLYPWSQPHPNTCTEMGAEINLKVAASGKGWVPAEGEKAVNVHCSVCLPTGFHEHVRKVGGASQSLLLVHAARLFSAGSADAARTRGVDCGVLR